MDPLYGGIDVATSQASWSRVSALPPRPLDPRPSTLDPRPTTLDPRPSTLDPYGGAFNQEIIAICRLQLNDNK